MKSNLDFVIRYPKQSDLKSINKYINKLSKEKTYIRLQGEQISLKEEKKWLQDKLKNIKNKKCVVLIITKEKAVFGICNVDLHDKTESHVASLGLSVDSMIRGMGLGEKLLTSSINEATKNFKNIKLITLRVQSDNKVAINLYKKLGFIKYGYLPNGTTHKGKYKDEIFMYKKIT